MSDPRLRVIQRNAQADEDAILGVLDGRTIAVRLPAGQPEWPHQLLALALVDLLGRVFARTAIDVDPNATADGRLPPGPDGLAERLAAAREHGTPPGEPGAPDLTIAIGRHDAAADLHVDGAGWQSYLGKEPSRLDPGNADAVPIGPLLAAARGAAHAFALLMREHGVAGDTPASIYSSALDYATAPDPLLEPELAAAFSLNAVQVGAGSVGGAADYALAATPGLDGTLEIVDPQALESLNAYRALLAPRAAADARRDKAAVAEAAFAHHPLQARGRRLDVEAWLATRDREAPLPIVLCAVDSAASRREIQDCLPRELINAACHPTEATVSRHRTGLGPCVCCLHMADVLDSRNIRARLIERATGFNFNMVIGLMINPAPVTPQHLQAVERHNKMPDGALAHHAGTTLEELYERALLYGAARVETSSGSVIAVAAPWVTALAGFLLASEALKAAGGEPYAEYALGHGGPVGIKLEEGVYRSPEHRLLTRPARWERDECLCRSPRRARLIIERYGLDTSTFEL